MRNCPLTQLVVSVLLCTFVAISCGKDPILEAVDAMEDNAGAEGGPGSESGALQKGVPEDPQLGVPEEPLPGSPTGEPGLAAEPEKGTPAEPEPGTPTDPEPAAPGTSDQPEPPPSAGGGDPAEPQPGVPKDPEPAPPGSPGGAHHEGKEAGGAEEGPHVLIRGRIDAPGGSGVIRIDMFDGDQRNVAGPRPKVVGVHEIATPGRFEVSVPQSHRRVWLGAYRDLNGNNRPDKGEPTGWYKRNPVFLDGSPPSVVIELEVEGKASDLGLDFGE